MKSNSLSKLYSNYNSFQKLLVSMCMFVHHAQVCECVWPRLWLSTTCFLFTFLWVFLIFMCVFVFAQVLMQTTCWYKYTQSTIVNQKHTMYVYIKCTNQISTGHNNRYTGKCQPINVWNTTIVMANVNPWVCELQLLPWQMSTHECVNYNCYHGKYQPISVDYNWCHGKCQPLSVWITTDTMANVNPWMWITTIAMANVNPWGCELQLIPRQMSTTECVNYNYCHGKCQPMNVGITTVTMANVNPRVYGLQLIPWQMSTDECVDYNW